MHTCCSHLDFTFHIEIEFPSAGQTDLDTHIAKDCRLLGKLTSVEEPARGLEAIKITRAAAHA